MDETVQNILNRNVEIILIEDNPSDEELILLAFKSSHFSQVMVLRDGQEAVDFFSQFKSSNFPMLKVVFLDLKLPKIDGIEVLNFIKQNKNTKKLPIVILTSSEEEIDKQKAYNEYANSYIVKPINYEKLKIITKTIGNYWTDINKI